MNKYNLNRVLAVLAALVMMGASAVQAELMFRGLPLYQQENVLESRALDRPIPFASDVLDEFNRGGFLSGSEADGLQIGFVPPVDGVPDGPLTGGAADAHGRWMSGVSAGLETQNGSVHRTVSSGISTACVPWRVSAGLGDDYLIEMAADVAQGEQVRLGYFGNISTFGALQGLAGRLGQLVLGIQRGSDTDSDPNFNSEDLRWTVAWDVNGTRLSLRGETTAPVGDELRLQLGWKDDNRDGDDTFDAWLGSSSGNRRLAAGNLGTNLTNAIEVFGIGFEMLGSVTGANESWIGNFIGAVPEPNSAGLMIAALMLLLSRRRGGQVDPKAEFTRKHV